MSAEKLVCLVTMHGVGFQQIPDPATATAGYADALHRSLAATLGDMLGGDTDPQGNSPNKRSSDDGPIYVSSHWPTEDQNESVELGLSRLGTWDPDVRQPLKIDSDHARLQDRGRPIAHIALVLGLSLNRY